MNFKARMNPYKATNKTQVEQLKGFQWRRIIVFSVVIYAAVNMVAILAGISMARWQIYGATMEAAVNNCRIVRRFAYVLVGAFLYWRLAAPLASRRWLHVLLALFGVQILDIIVPITLSQVIPSEVIELGSLFRGSLAALLGWVLACLGSHSSPTHSQPDAAP